MHILQYYQIMFNRILHIFLQNESKNSTKKEISLPFAKLVAK